MADEPANNGLTDADGLTELNQQPQTGTISITNVTSLEDGGDLLTEKTQTNTAVSRSGEDSSSERDVIITDVIKTEDCEHKNDRRCVDGIVKSQPETDFVCDSEGIYLDRCDEDVKAEVKEDMIDLETNDEGCFFGTKTSTSQDNGLDPVTEAAMDEVIKNIKEEEDPSCTNANGQESTFPVRRMSGRKRKQNRSYVNFFDLSNDLEEADSNEGQTKRRRKREHEDELYEPPPETIEGEVKKKRGRPKKIKSQPSDCGVNSDGEIAEDEKAVHVEEKTSEFICKDCRQGFVSLVQLKKHELTCKQLKSTGTLLHNAPLDHTTAASKHKCPVCSKQFVRRNGVKRHLSVEHRNLVHITCGLCHKRIGDIDDNLQHILSQHQSASPDEKDKGLPFCPVCGESFKKTAYLRQHVTNIHANLLHFTCALCQRTVGAMLDYLQHFQTYHATPTSNQEIGSDVYVTEMPNCVTQTPKDLNGLRSESELVCLKCNKTVDNYTLLVLHSLSHKLDENMAQVHQECSLSRPSVEQESSQNNTSNTEPDSGKSTKRDQDEFPVPLFNLQKDSDTNWADGFSFLGYELVSAFNRSLIALTEMSSRLHENLNWTDSTCPKNKEDLSNKLSNLLRLSGGITDIGKCLLLVLEESKQLKGKNPYLDDEDDDIVVNSNPVEDETSEEVSDQRNTGNISENRSNDDDQVVDDVDGSEKVVSSGRNESTIEVKCEKDPEKAGKVLVEGKESNEEIFTTQTQTPNSTDRKKSEVLCENVNRESESQSSVINVGDDVSRNSHMESDNVGEQIVEGQGTTEPNQKTSIKSKKKKKKFVCKKCGKQLAKASSLRQHRLVHLDIRPFQCKVCTARFKSDNALKRHMAIHLKGDKFKCDFCDVSVRTLKDLHIHMVLHKSEEFFQCDQCKHQARTSYDLAAHKKKHEPVSCKKCGFQAKHQCDLRIHQRKKHVSLSCPKCDFACCTNFQLTRHLKTHNKLKEKIFCCELCGATFDTKRKLSYHVVRHSNKTPLSCPHCDYKCSAKSSFDAHILKHSGLRPFLCTVCGAGFQRTSHLKQHSLKHSDEMKFECKTCGKGFKYRYNFHEHQMIHTGEKKFKCQLCDFACRRRKILDAHIAKHKARGSDVEMSENEAETSSIC